MKQFELIVCLDGAPKKTGRLSDFNQRYLIPEGGGLIIGRSSAVDVRLHDKEVSRRHARILADGDKVLIEDMGSRNGILLNGKQTKYAEITEKDQVRIGAYSMHLVPVEDLSAVPTLKVKLKSSSISGETSQLLVRQMLDEIPEGRLRVLYRATELMGTIFNADKLYESLLDLIFDSLPVRRGFILTVKSLQREPVIQSSRTHPEEPPNLPFSNTLIHHVLNTRESMLTPNAQSDPRFKATSSIIGHRIGSAMCVPLYGRTEIIGVIYVDNGAIPKTAFKEEDLQLLTAVARIAGIAVENTHLYQENIAREHMAALGMAVAGMGHCIKNIVMAIRGGTTVIDKALERNDLEMARKGWPVLARAMDRIDALVMNMLTYSAEVEPKREATDIAATVKEVFKVMAYRAAFQNAKLHFNPSTTATVNTDSQALYRILLNLVTNAVEAIVREKGGNVTVSCERVIGAEPEDCGVQIHVQDDADGIPEDVLSNLFKAFKTTKAGGSGLGLACSQKLANELGGEIEVQTKIGAGSTFTLWLPDQNNAEKIDLNLTMNA